MEAVATGVEAIATRVEAIASRLEAIAIAYPTEVSDSDLLLDLPLLVYDLEVEISSWSGKESSRSRISYFDRTILPDTSERISSKRYRTSCGLAGSCPPLAWQHLS